MALVFQRNAEFRICNEKNRYVNIALPSGALQLKITEPGILVTEPDHSPASQALNDEDRSVLTIVSSLVGGFNLTSTLDFE